MRRAVASMERGKAVGEDGLALEMITAAGEQAFQRLVKIMIEAYRTERYHLIGKNSS